jgi:hypothetical protein
MNIYSPRLGRMSAAERSMGRYMRGPDDHASVDITQDLTGGADDASLGDAVPLNGAGDNVQPARPEGTQPVHAQDSRRQPAEADASNVSLRDALSTAFKDDTGKPTEQQNAQNAQPNTQPQGQQPPALTKDNDGKYRQADGTFASAEQIAAFEAAQQQPNTQPEVASPVLQSLTPAEQQQFQSLPAELRQFVERTMEDLNTRGARYGEYDVLEQQLIGPRREAWAAQGLNPLVAINQLFALSDFASTKPGDFVLWFAGSNGVDLEALLDAQAAHQQPVDPNVRRLEGTIQQLQGTVQQFQQGQEAAAHQARLAEVQTFASEKDEAGNLKRPYLTEVTDAWATQIGLIRAANPQMPNAEILQRAYDAACWTNPQVRAKMQEANIAQQRQQEAQRVNAARVAGSSVTGAPGGDTASVPNNANRTLRDELSYQYDALSA